MFAPGYLLTANKQDLPHYWTFRHGDNTTRDLVSMDWNFATTLVQQYHINKLVFEVFEDFCGIFSFFELYSIDGKCLG